MKNIYYTSLLAVSLFFTGCDNFLDDTSVVNTENLDSGFETEKNVDAAMVGCYAEIKSTNGLMGRNGLVFLDVSSADLKITREGNSVNNYTFNTSKDDESFDKMWRNYYQIIGRCNTAIEVVPNSLAPAAKKSRYDSEAKVIRSIMYYYLMMYYNTCPLVLKTIQPGDRAGMLTPDATRDQIYTALIADLEAAISNPNFPWEKDIAKNEKGKVGQATARTILTYVYLTRGWEKNSAADFNKAKTLAKEVIDMGGYSLEPVLLDAYYKKFCSESIWEIVCTNAAEGLGNHNSPWFAPMTAPAGADKKYYNGWYKLHSTQKLVDAIEVGDARRYLLAYGSGINQEWAPKFLGGTKYGGPIQVIDKILDNDWGLPAYQNAKGVSPTDWYNRLDDLTTSTDYVVYRLSDVYLLYAEACIQTNDFGNARTYINKVRERARNAWTTYLPAGDPAIPAHIAGVPADIDASVTGAALLAALKHERRVELNAEMKKMLDVRRWSLGGASDIKDEVSISGSWQEKYRWFPKPVDQVRLSEGNVKQNLGY
jgi:starch-binding outer membrane protein, SusD/RagB family